MSFFSSTSGADWLIAGLGNPEPKYDGTRHNTGFVALDYLARRWNVSVTKSKWQGLYGIAEIDGHKVVLLKPLGTVLAGTVFLFLLYRKSYRWYMALVISAVISIALFVVFRILLEVNLPINAFGF